MKRKRTFIIFLLAVLMVFIRAEAESFQELMEEKESLCKALWYAEEWEEVLLPIGTYKVGRDVPEGECTFEAYDYARPMIQYGKNLRKGSASMHSTNDAEIEAILTSKKLEFFDPMLDDVYLDVGLENGKNICISYGSAVLIKSDRQHMLFEGEIASELKELSAEEIRERINEINKKLITHEHYDVIFLPEGNWEVGDDLPCGIYEVRPANDKANVKYGPKNGNEKNIVPFQYYYSNKLTAFESSLFSIANDDTVEYIELEEGNIIEIKKGGIILSTYIGREPLTFLKTGRSTDAEIHVWNELDENEKFLKSLKKLIKVLGN